MGILFCCDFTCTSFFVSLGNLQPRCIPWVLQDIVAIAVVLVWKPTIAAPAELGAELIQYIVASF